MKAVILAGGEGTRLRPLSAGRPKPMVPLFDRPVMEHIIALLRANGVTDICVTLHYMPQMITSYFGDGTQLGVRLTYFREEEPMGTAGGVKQCAHALGEGDFLVVSGDAVCDFDLRACAQFHAERRADATLALYRSGAPLEYGLVLTQEGGAVRRFIEKPAWGQVVTDMVNTGIYVLNSRIFEKIPDGIPFDFAKDLFPQLLREGRPIFGCEARGYWRDIGDCGAYLDCVADALSGKVHLELGVPRRAPGIWAAQPLPEGITVIPPCYVGRGVSIGEGALIGPHTALGALSSVGRRAMVQRTVVHGAAIGERAVTYGAVLCRGAGVKEGAVLNEGTVIGENAVIGAHASLRERVRVWPGKEVPPGIVQSENLTVGALRSILRFGDGGVIAGDLNTEITPGMALSLGMVLGAGGQKIGLGHCGGAGARLLVQTLGCGVCASGGEAVLHDAPCESAAAWAQMREQWQTSVFVRQEEVRILLRFCGSDGLPITRAQERSIEGAMQRGETQSAAAQGIGQLQVRSGLRTAYLEEAISRTRLFRGASRPLTVAVQSGSRLAPLLREGLRRSGASVVENRTGVPLLIPEHGGLRLSAVDENGMVVSPERILTLLCMIEFENGSGHVAVDEWAPAAVDLLADAYKAQVLHLGSGGEAARRLYREQLWMRDALFAALRICARMGFTGETLHALCARLPRFFVERREVPLVGDRGAVMRALAQEHKLSAGENEEGLRLRMGAGWVRIAPLNRRAALRIVAEGEDAEMAAELCAVFERKARQIDGGMKK